MKGVRFGRLLACTPLMLAPLRAAIDVETARAFDHFYNLEFDEAVGAFANLVAARPASAPARNHLAQSVLYREMLRSGALETELVTGGNAFLRRAKMNPSAEDARLFDSSIAEAIRLSKAALAANPSDKPGLYSLGVAHGLRANYNFLVRKAWIDSLRDATAARTAHDRLTALEPGRADTRLVQGAHEYMVGSLPWIYRALGFLGGFRGDKEQGIRTLQMVWERGDDNKYDAAILLATIYRRERRPAEAVPLLESLLRKFPRNYLFQFELAQMQSDLGNPRKALEAIDAVDKLKLAGSPGYKNVPVEKIWYFRATVQFWYRDLDAALANFQRVTAKAAELDLNTGVTAWMRLGQTYDLTGDRPKALEAYRGCIAYAPGSYRAKEAEGYLKSPFRRN